MAMALATLLMASQGTRSALAWLSLFGAGAFFVLSTQIAYAGWDIGVEQFDFTGISGHSFGATSVFSVAAYYIGSRFSAAAAFVAGCLGFCLGILVGISRIILGAHSPSEVIIGCALGGAIALASNATLRYRPRTGFVTVLFAFAIGAIVCCSQEHRAPSHQLAVRVALYLTGRSAPFARGTH